MFGFANGGKINTDQKLITKLLTRNVEEIFVKDDLEKKLKSGERLRIKLGFDPTSTNIHLGRAITLRKLREFQDLGHKAIFIVGDFTAQIGDPSDKLEKRPMLTHTQINENLREYKKMIGKIIDLPNAEFHYNRKWLSKLDFKEISELAEGFTVSQMTNRRNFKERLEKGDEISLREFMYPLMQGYDSVEIKADVELGGFDQLFNLKAGRTIQKHYKQKPQDVLTTVMLEGTDGRKMSSSWGNVINVTDEPDQMYGKIMSLKDDLIVKYFVSCTDIEEGEIVKLEKELKTGKNPKEIKMLLASTIVIIYYSEEAAVKAEENFINTFTKKGEPDEVQEITIKKGTKLMDVLSSHEIVSSKTEYRRLIKDGAIKDINLGVKIEKEDFGLDKKMTLRIGKKRFIKIIIQ